MSRCLPAVLMLSAALLSLFSLGASGGDAATYPIVDTHQQHAFSDRGQLTQPLRPGGRFDGQDACYLTHAPSYRDNGDGTVTDLVTGLMWQQDDGDKITYAQAVDGARQCRTGGHDDWRLPTIKELYSLIDFNGNSHARKPYLDTRYFRFTWGDAVGGRPIDAQYWSATAYLGYTMDRQPTIFGVNFADGRIKGYPRDRGPRNGRMGSIATHFVKYVRGNPAYGENRFIDNGDGTISDLATGLMWTKADSGKPMDWEHALAWAESQRTAGHDDWRLPNAKELQSIVDYNRAPDAPGRAQQGPAIDPVFDITDPASYFWSSTTHLEGPGGGGRAAAYIAFGCAMGKMHGRVMNVHGAGAQRSDPKSGDPARYQGGHLGPQGDDIRIDNYARAVRNINPADVRRVTPSADPIDGLDARPPAPGMGPGMAPGMSSRPRDDRRDPPLW